MDTTTTQPPTLIFETRHGSHCYGLATATSDEDFKGVIVGPRAWYFGFTGGPEQVEIDGADHVRFEVRKLARLCEAANPTALEVLWTDPADHLVVTPAGDRLLGARELFLSRRVAGTFGGYAMSQLKRIRSHRAWLLNPPTGPPTRKDFNLPERTIVSRDQLGAAEALIERGDLAAADLTPNFLELMDRERRYRQARKHWEQYRGWLKNRNPDRAALEARFGYDTKHALHLVRLLRMGAEVLRTGQLFVRRDGTGDGGVDDRDELLAIKGGAWSYDELLEHAEALHAGLAAHVADSPLPERPDTEALDALCVAIIDEVLR